MIIDNEIDMIPHYLGIYHIYISDKANKDPKLTFTLVLIEQKNVSKYD